MRFDPSILNPNPTARQAILDVLEAALQGIDPATLRNVMAPQQVAGLALENIDNGPVLICSEHYKAVFEQLLALPRRQALTLMAGSMKK